ncbi:hypothetical protein K7395_24310 [Streptomyces filamentosus]|uniref:Uncharacterized protein n=2 Tax=Streptomyces filamentosus TaxID=67294 RepID=A0ABY4V4P7_STRFL|nr:MULTISPECIES: hypothetical protein [Streptomyces]NUV69543.1 hypothetical protein [Streptomyces sp. CAI-121]NUW02836.1 hypothetical protein [Streptomyces sp. CAI 127]NUW15686.1 hypothetical protein [Streptomyces sp. CAI-68]USC49619.1 hypothetical protein K7395_24310 [Streptomyces filamentosus]SBU98013.1 hypothetical protein YW5DRAFT_05727 [Streptomyces sp. Ncost-T6T-1]
MSENTKPAADETNETPEVEAHSVLDLQETSVQGGDTTDGNCISVLSVVESQR